MQLTQYTTSQRHVDTARGKVLTQRLRMEEGNGSAGRAHLKPADLAPPAAHRPMTPPSARGTRPSGTYHLPPLACGSFAAAPRTVALPTRSSFVYAPAPPQQVVVHGSASTGLPRRYPAGVAVEAAARGVEGSAGDDGRLHRTPITPSRQWPLEAHNVDSSGRVLAGPSAGVGSIPARPGTPTISATGIADWGDRRAYSPSTTVETASPHRDALASSSSFIGASATPPPSRLTASALHSGRPTPPVAERAAASGDGAHSWDSGRRSSSGGGDRGGQLSASVGLYAASRTEVADPLAAPSRGDRVSKLGAGGQPSAMFTHPSPPQSVVAVGPSTLTGPRAPASSRESDNRDLQHLASSTASAATSTAPSDTADGTPGGLHSSSHTASNSIDAADAAIRQHMAQKAALVHAVEELAAELEGSDADRSR